MKTIEISPGETFNISLSGAAGGTPLFRIKGRGHSAIPEETEEFLFGSQLHHSHVALLELNEVLLEACKTSLEFYTNPWTTLRWPDLEKLLKEAIAKAEGAE